ncbi:MAG: hypothetical protein ACTTHG_04605 [Treponemataceae bacterium]
MTSKLKVNDILFCICIFFSTVALIVSLINSNEIKKNFTHSTLSHLPEDEVLINNVFDKSGSEVKVLQHAEFEQNLGKISDSDFEKIFQKYEEKLKSGYLKIEKDNAFILFSQKKYCDAYEKFNSLSRICDDVEIRFFTIYSLFLSNKMDSSNYELYSTEISKLKDSGYYRKEMDEIEVFIRYETGEVDSEVNL